MNATYMSEAHHTYECRIPHTWTRHVTRMNATYMSEARHTYERGHIWLPHISARHLAYICGMLCSNLWPCASLIYVAFICVTCLAHIRHTYERGVSLIEYQVQIQRMRASQPWWVTPRHVPHLNTSCHIHERDIMALMTDSFSIKCKYKREGLLSRDEWVTMAQKPSSFVFTLDMGWLRLVGSIQS